MEQWERKRRFFIVMPLLALPFITFLFWILGGGTVAQGAPPASQGINANLPSAQLESDSPDDKMSLYRKADQDSLAFQEELSKDPFLQEQRHPAEISPFSAAEPIASTSDKYSPIEDPNERIIKQKLALLNEQLQKESTTNENQKQDMSTEAMYHQKDQDIAQLEEMMKALGSPQNNTEDPELAQLNGMLEKVLDIQHPDRMKEKLRNASAKDKSRVFPVQRRTDEAFDDLLIAPGIMDSASKNSGNQNAKIAAQSAFFGIDENTPDHANNGITAVIHQNQTLVSGANIKLRTTQDMYLRGILIPTGTFISGLCNLSGERLQINIENIRYQDAVYPVNLNVYSLDGMAGVHIPGAINRDAAKQGAEDAIQTLQMSSLDPSITAQAASAGIETVKSLITKKAKLIRVVAKADHPVLLLNDSED